MLSITVCPVCSHQSFEPYLSCVDHTVSHETFPLLKCANCTFIVTSPRPTDGDLGAYYLSDEYISHSSKATTLFDKIYRLARHFTLRWKLRLVLENLSVNTGKPSLLDYGCGTGAFLKTAKDKGFIVAGVEPSQIARHTAIKITGEQIAKRLVDIDTDQFDAITLWHVLEHIPDLSQTVSALKMLLATNGTMFIAVPNHNSIDAKIYGSNWAAYDVPRHLWHFNRDTMKLLMATHGLRIEKIIPMKLDAFYVSMLSEKTKPKANAPSIAIKGFINGLRSNFGKNNGDYSSLIYIIKNDTQ
jgi:2-polyprenyl-3-methyl-5-hydroxy-6-metoxy-1,4-benzoquinol methylase